MKQTIKGIIGVGAITLFFYILFSILNFAQAIPNDTPTIPSPEPEKKYDLNSVCLPNQIDLVEKLLLK